MYTNKWRLFLKSLTHAQYWGIIFGYYRESAYRVLLGGGITVTESQDMKIVGGVVPMLSHVAVLDAIEFNLGEESDIFDDVGREVEQAADEIRVGINKGYERKPSERR